MVSPRFLCRPTTLYIIARAVLCRPTTLYIIARAVERSSNNI